MRVEKKIIIVALHGCFSYKITNFQFYAENNHCIYSKIIIIMHFDIKVNLNVNPANWWSTKKHTCKSEKFSLECWIYYSYKVINT